MTTLAQYDAARAALAAATRVDEVLPLREQMEHIKLHARHVQDRELMADATEIQIRAETKLGFLLGEAKKAGLLKASRPKKLDPKKPAELEGFTLKEIGVTEKLSAGAQKKASISEQALEAMIGGIRQRIISGKAKIIDAEPINGARALMGSRQEDPDSLDYFPTPPWATRALMECVLPHLGVNAIDSVWEPACGEGHIAEVLSEYCRSVFASDIANYGYPQTLDTDFLKVPVDGDPFTDWIITNPPFGDKAAQFVLRAIEEAGIGVAMFFRLQWIPSNGRYEKIFRDHPPTLVSFFCERVNLCKGRWDPDGSTATDYIWLVWLKGEQPRAPFWIPPGQRQALEREGDRERFTTHPVTHLDREQVLPPHDLETGEIFETQPSGRISPGADSSASRPASASASASAELPPQCTLSTGDDALDIPQFLRRAEGAETPA